MSQFSDLIADARTGAPKIPESWKQGRTAYGGLSAAFLLMKVRADFSDLPPLRSAMVNFTGPVADDPHITTECLRRGRNVTTIYAVAKNGDKTVCTATFSFGAARESSIHVEGPRVETPSPDDIEPFIPPGAAKFSPGFTQHFDTRLIEGERPMTGAQRGYIRCWSRHRDETAREGEIALLCIGDVLPPAALSLLTQMGPVSSMTWMLNILREPDTNDGWYMLESDLTAAREGYSSQVMRIFNRKGELVADAMQSVAIFA